MNACPTPVLDVGLIRDILGSVDCNVQLYSAAGYKALAGPGSPLPRAMTVMLTIYVAILGYRMLFAVEGIRLAQAPVIALKVGVILALTLNWSVFQTLVFNLGAQAPLEIGRVISGPMATQGPPLAQDPLRGLQMTYDELSAAASDLGKKSAQAAPGALAAVAAAGPQAGSQGGDEAATAADLRHAAAALLFSSVGILAAAFIATGVLTAIGPVFIALFLFEATDGLFVGWVRALVAAVLIPMVCWIGSSVLLVVLAPRIELLAQQRAAHAINLHAASAAADIVMIFAAAQTALIMAVLIVGAGFRLHRRAPVPDHAPAAPREAPVIVTAFEERSRAEALATSLRRSTASYSRDPAAIVQAGGASYAEPAAGRLLEAAPRTVRLGETYRRRSAAQERGRLGART
jgi:type IV secretion system protein VirB6